MFSRIIPSSRLYDQIDFYRIFKHDLMHARHRIIIESPFITFRRFNSLLPLIRKVLHNGVIITVNTRNPQEHKAVMRTHALECIATLQDLGAQVLYTNSLHRKISIIDDIIYEGSLNILSQSDSCEIMRRTESAEYARDLIRFIKMTKWYN